MTSASLFASISRFRSLHDRTSCFRHFKFIKDVSSTSSLSKPSKATHLGRVFVELSRNRLKKVNVILRMRRFQLGIFGIGAFSFASLSNLHHERTGTVTKQTPLTS